MTFLLHFHDHISWVPFLLFNLLPHFLKNFHRILSSGLSHILRIAIMNYKSFGQYSIKQKSKGFIAPVAVFLCAFWDISSCFAVIEDRLITTILKPTYIFVRIKYRKSSTRIFIRCDSFVIFNLLSLRRFIILISSLSFFLYCT